MRLRLCLFVAALAASLAQETFQGVEVIVPRDDTEISVRNLDTSEEARSPINNRNCKEDFVTSIFYGPQDPFVVTTTDDAEITSAIVIIEKPDTDDSEEQERLEFFGGGLTFDRPRCAEKIERSDDPSSVKIVKGRSTITGISMVLEPEEDVGTLSGPVDLQRTAEGDSPALSASSETADFNFETETSVLNGGVQIESDGRVSSADSVDFDDANNIAILRGSPAKSEKDGDVVQANVITYFLDSNDIYAVGGIQGNLEFDTGENATTTTTTAGEDPTGEEGFEDEEGFEESEEFGDEFGDDFD